MGIPMAVQASIFEKFTQADTSITRQFGGTGLGLAISKELSTLMGGSVNFVSKEGSGSTFWMDLPLDVDRSVPSTSATVTGQRMITASQRLQPGERTTRTAQGRHKILLVEDNRVNQKLLARMLESRNCTTIIAENGKQAVDRFEAEEFDMILMDCQMPVLDGYRATAAIRALEESLGVRTPIVALTANAMVGDRERCLAAGMDDYLSKPVHREELDNTLVRWLPVPVEG
jgi:CheY-like chemotaxis protein